jgi:hypothetical protein
MLALLMFLKTLLMRRMLLVRMAFFISRYSVYIYDQKIIPKRFFVVSH